MNSISFSCFSDGVDGKMAKSESHCLLRGEKIAGLLFLRARMSDLLCGKYLSEIQPFDCVCFLCSSEFKSGTKLLWFELFCFLSQVTNCVQLLGLFSSVRCFMNPFGLKS